MRDRPRTWPSIRPSRLRQEPLTSLRMAAYIPLPPIGVKTLPLPPMGTKGHPFAGEAMQAMDDAQPHAAHAHDHPAGVAAPEHAGARDPVCGMTVDPHTTPHRHTYQGHPYYFCSAGCRAKFAAGPQTYLGDAK